MRRVEANFELWRAKKNDPSAPEITDDGAFLCAAITDGYANVTGKTSHAGENPPSEEAASGDANEGDATEDISSTPPADKQKVSPEEKAALVRRWDEVQESHFHRFRHGKDPTEKQFLYLDPEGGGPKKRVSR